MVREVAHVWSRCFHHSSRVMSPNRFPGAVLKGILWSLVGRLTDTAQTQIAMKYLIFDAETTGIPEDRTAPSSDTDNWTRVVQLAWAVFSDEDGASTDVSSFVARPDGFTIPEKAARIHGITTARAKEEGHHINEVLGAFYGALRGADGLVAHNMAFDAPTVGAEFFRAVGKDPLEDRPQTCTMKETTQLCGLSSPGGYGYKWPTLQELHWELFGHGFASAHDAGADVAACASCFTELVRRGLIEPPAPAPEATSTKNTSTVDRCTQKPDW